MKRVLVLPDRHGTFHSFLLTDRPNEPQSTKWRWSRGEAGVSVGQALGSHLALLRTVTMSVISAFGDTDHAALAALQERARVRGITAEELLGT